MKIGNYVFKRRYSIAQIIVDIASVGAMALLLLVISAHLEWVEYLDKVNRTDKELNTDFKPLIVWIVLGVLVFVFSFVLIFKNRKLPKKYSVNSSNAAKFCNIVDTGISCVRLMMLIILFDLSSSHSYLILFGKFEFPTISILSALIIVGIIVFTRIRLNAVCENIEEKPETKNKDIIED